MNKYKKVTKPVPNETKKDVVKMVELNKAGKGKVSGSLGPENPESTDEDKDLHLDPSVVSYKLQLAATGMSIDNPDSLINSFEELGWIDP